MMAAQLEAVRLTALYVDDLVSSLSSSDARELAELLARHPDFDRASIETAVALLQIAADPLDEELPGPLRDRLENEAAEFFAGAALRELPTRHLPTAPAPRVTHGGSVTSRWWRRVLPLALAAALGAVAVLGTVSRERPAAPVTTVAAGGDVADSGAAPGPAPPAPVPAAPDVAASPAPAEQATPTGEPLEPAAARKAFLAAHPWLVQRSWQAGNYPAGSQLHGDVVWDPRSQTGFLRFVGLPPNNPLVEQYQLWIVDGRRDPRFPVDGGVFNVAARGGPEVVVPIRSKLAVEFAMTFVVTVERPGGVVVSDRSRIAAVAQIS